MCSSYIRWIVTCSIGCIVLRTSRCGSTKKALSRVQEKQKVRCPRGCHVPLRAHRVVHTHINRYVQGTALSPHYDLEGPERAPWPHCSALLLLLPHSSWVGGGELRVAKKPGDGERISHSWHRDSVGIELYDGWDGVWLVTRRTRMSLYELAICLYELSYPALYQCPSPLCDGGGAHGRYPGDDPGGYYP